MSESDVDSTQENIKSSNDFENTSDFSASQETIENNSQTFIVSVYLFVVFFTFVYFELWKTIPKNINRKSMMITQYI